MAGTDNGSFAARNGLWLGPLLAVPGLISYFVFFSRWPLFRDTPWLNLIILAIATWLSVAGLLATWSGGALRRVAGGASTFVSVAATGMLLFYSYGLSYDLPDAEMAAHDGDTIPQAILLADDGTQVDLGAAAAGRLILVFYRGFW